ncbi:MAG: hypothetical protein ABWX68_07780, partial [Arthrobacter sp.]
AEQTRGSGFNDLPDGRPQFGIRVDAGTTPPESGQALGADAQVDADAPGSHAPAAAQDSATGQSGNAPAADTAAVEPARDDDSGSTGQRKPGEGPGN